MLAFRLARHLRWHRWKNTRSRHCKTWYCSALCIIVTLAFRLHCFWLLLNKYKKSFLPPNKVYSYLNMLKFYSTCFWSHNVSWWEENIHDVKSQLEVLIVRTKRFPHNIALSLYHTELMSLNFTHSSMISRRSNCFWSADVTAACHEVHTYINIRLCWPKQNEITWNWFR